MPTQNELNHWSAIFLDKLKSLPGITDVTSDQENAGPRLNVTVNRDVASSFGILPSTIDNTLDDAFGQRIVSTIYTALNQYHVVLEVDPRFQRGPEALNDIYLNSSSRHRRCRSARWSTATITAAPIVINHQGHVPGDDHLLQPEARRGARRRGRRHPADRAAERQACSRSSPPSRATPTPFCRRSPASRS